MVPVAATSVAGTGTISWTSACQRASKAKSASMQLDWEWLSTSHVVI